MPDPLYKSVAAIREEGGITEAEADNTALELSIRTWQKAIDRICRQWFFAKDLELWVDGSGADGMFFGVPIISISDLRLNGSTTNLAVDKYKVYTDLTNPRIMLTNMGSMPRDIFTRPFGDYPDEFSRGTQNTYVKGVFGYLEDGAAPLLIQRALTLLVLEKLRGAPLNPSAAATAYAPPTVPGILRDEWVDGHRKRYDVAGGRVADRKPWVAGLTNNPEVIQILRMYRAPIGLATPSDRRL